MLSGVTMFRPRARARASMASARSRGSMSDLAPCRDQIPYDDLLRVRVFRRTACRNAEEEKGARRRRGRAGRRAGHPAAAADASRAQADAADRRACRSSTHLLARIRAVGVAARRARHLATGRGLRPTTSATGRRSGCDIEYVTEDEPLGTGGGIRNVADRLRRPTTVLIFNGDILSGRRPRAPCVDTHRSRGRGRHAAPGRVDGPARVRLRADRRRRAGSWRSWRRPRTRRPTRSTPAATSSAARWSTPSRPAGRSRWSARRSPACSPTGARSPGHVDATTGWTSARRRPSCRAPPTSSAASHRPARSSHRPARRWCCPAPRSPTARLSAAAAPSGAAAQSRRAPGWTARCSSTAPGSWRRRGRDARRGRAGRGGRRRLRGLRRRARRRCRVGARNELRDGARVWPGVSLRDVAVRFSTDAWMPPVLDPPFPLGVGAVLGPLLRGQVIRPSARRAASGARRTPRTDPARARLAAGEVGPALGPGATGCWPACRLCSARTTRWTSSRPGTRCWPTPAGTPRPPGRDRAPALGPADGRDAGAEGHRHEACRSWRELGRRYGEPAPGPPALRCRRRRGRCWPTELGLAPGRGRPPRRRTLGNAARSRAAGEGRRDGSRERLAPVPGVGAWTAAEVAQRACGDADAVTVGDYHVAKTVGWALAGRPVDDAGMMGLLEPYRPHRHRAVCTWRPRACNGRGERRGSRRATTAGTEPEIRLLSAVILVAVDGHPGRAGWRGSTWRRACPADIGSGTTSRGGGGATTTSTAPTTCSPS